MDHLNDLTTLPTFADHLAHLADFLSDLADHLADLAGHLADLAGQADLAESDDAGAREFSVCFALPVCQSPIANTVVPWWPLVKCIVASTTVTWACSDGLTESNSTSGD